jgi:hypothetical protein
MIVDVNNIPRIAIITTHGKLYYIKLVPYCKKVTMTMKMMKSNMKRIMIRKA